MNTIPSVSCFAMLCLGSALASARGGQVMGRIPCPVEEPTGMAVDGDHLWLSDLGSRSIYKVRKSDGSVVQKLDTPGLMPTGLAWHDGTLYAADRRMSIITRRRPGEVADHAPIEYFERWATGMTHDGDHLWIVDSRAAKIHKIDPADGTTVASYDAPAAMPTGIAFDGQYLWVADHEEDEIYMLDRRQARVVVILAAPGPYPSALAVDNGSLWVADYQTGQLYRMALPDETPYVEDEPRRVRASFEAIYRTKGQGNLSMLTASIAIPREIPGQHLLGELRWEPQPQRFETDKWGQQVAVFELGALQHGETKRVGWAGTFAVFRTRFHIIPERVDSARLPGNLAAYLADDEKYDLSSRTIGDLVDELTGRETSYYWRARAVFEHLTKVITYDRSGGWNNAATVLARGTGSCSEYTFAAVALLRRAGIPARYVGAVSERGDEAGFDDVFHRWAEAYMPGYGWIPIDANAGYGKPPGERAGFFGGRSNRHVVTTIGGGGSEYLEWDYNAHQTYQSHNGAELEARAIARYRPLGDDDKEVEVKPHQAPRVLAPTLTAPLAEGTPLRPRAASSVLASPWMGAIAVLLAMCVGIIVGRLGRRSQ